MVLCSVIHEANFLRQFYQNMKGDQVEINIYANNKVLLDQMHHQTSKQIDVKYPYIRSKNSKKK